MATLTRTVSLTPEIEAAVVQASIVERSRSMQSSGKLSTGRWFRLAAHVGSHAMSDRNAALRERLAAHQARQASQTPHEAALAWQERQ